MNHVAKSVVAAAVVAGGLAGFAADAVLHRSMRFVGGSGSWTNPQNWYDVNGKTNDLPRETDIIVFDTAESNGAKNDIANFRAYGLRLSAFNQNYAKSGFLPVYLNAADDYGIYDSGFIYSTIPVRVTGTNLQFFCSQFFGLMGEFSSADGNPIGLVKTGKAIGGLAPSGLQTGVTNPYAGLKYIDVAEGTFAFNANAKVADNKLSLFPSGLVATFSAKRTTLAFNGNFTLADFTLRETGTAVNGAHAIGPQSSEYSGSIRLTGTPGADTTVFTGRMTGDFGFTWAPEASAKTFVFSGANAVSDMTGTLQVDNGTVRLADGATFTKLAKVVVKSSGRLEVLSAPASAFLADILSVPETGGVLSLAEGVSLTVGEVHLATAGVKAGTYTGSGPVGTPVAWLSGPGTLVVKRDCAHRVYWYGRNSELSGSGDSGVLANWRESDAGELVAATKLPQGGDVIVIDNRNATKALAPTTVFVNANKTKGLGGIVFEGSDVVNNSSRAIIWGDSALYVAGDAIFQNNLTGEKKTTRIWANTQIVGTGSGVRIGTARADGTWWQERTLVGNAPVIVDAAGKVIFADYNADSTSTHDPRDGTYSKNYNLKVPEMRICRGIAEYRNWYKLTNQVVRFAGDGTTLSIGYSKADQGYHDLWFGTGTYLDEVAGLAGTHKITSSGGACTLHVKDAPGVAVQTFTGSLTGATTFEFDPAGEGYEFVFAKGTSDTTGELQIGNGTVRVTDGARFTALSRVFVGATGVLAVGSDAAVGANVVEIADGGTVDVAKGGRLALKAVTVNGVPMEAGIYRKDSGWVTGEGRIYVGDVKWPEDQDAVWNRDEYPWQATGTTWYKGIRLYGESLTKTDLSAAEGAMVCLGASGIDLSAATTFAIGWPITLSGDQTWSLVGGSRLDFWGALDTYEPGTVTVAGTAAGKQIIFWTPSESLHDWWFGAKTTVVLRDGAGCGTGKITVDNGVLRPCGGEVPNAISFTNINNSVACLSAMDDAPRTTFLGPVSLPYPEHAQLDASKAPVCFKAMLSKPRGYIYFARGSTFEFDAPVNFGAGAMSFDGATLYLNAATNVVGSNNFQFGSNGKLFTTVPEALTSATLTKVNMNVEGSGAAVWNLCGSDQSVTYLKGGPYSTVTSETAAVVHVNSTSDYAGETSTWGATAWNAGVPTNYVAFAGGAGLQIDGDAKGYVRLAGLSVTTGTLTVAGGGLVEMAAREFYPPDGKTYKGQWPNASAVSVTKGTLDVQHREAFGKKTTLGVSGTASKVRLSYTGSMRVGGLVLDGVQQEIGTYGSPASSAQHKDSRFEGTGILRVGAVGEYLIIR